MFLVFSEVFLVFLRILHKGRISKNTLQISLTPAKILPLSIFPVSTPDCGRRGYGHRRGLGGGFGGPSAGVFKA